MLSRSQLLPDGTLLPVVQGKLRDKIAQLDDLA
jgi:hypothetical protein